MKCLVLGGGGFLGSHLCTALLGLGHQVRIFDRPNSVLGRFADCGLVEIIEGDFGNNNDIDAALDDCEIVFHLISSTIPKSSNDNPIHDVETNLVGTLQLLELSRRHPLRKIVFLSSGGTVYGIPKITPIRENHKTDPFCSYGITKLAIEKYLHLYHKLYGIDYCILRIANPFGEGQRVSSGQGAVAVFLNKALQKETIEIWGDGTTIRDYIYVSDVIDAILKAMFTKSHQKIFNIGSGKGYSLIDILNEIERLIQRQVNRTFMEPRSFDVPINVLDIGLAQKVLNWTPKISFQEGLVKTLKWMRERS